MRIQYEAQNIRFDLLVHIIITVRHALDFISGMSLLVILHNEYIRIKLLSGCHEICK